MKKKTSRTKKTPVLHIGEDFRNALLTVSLLINVFILCLWVALQITDIYDASLVRFFIHR